MVYLIILFIITGIIAGYLTNLYAVRWLFCPIKKRGKLPAWDISIAATDKKKNRLIKSLADCVTNSILTSDVLKEGIPDSVIETHLRKLIYEIFEQENLEKINSISWGQISGFQEVKQKGDRYVEHLVAESLVPFCESLFKKTDFSQILTEKQIHVIAQNFYNVLQQEIQKKEQYDQVLKGLCEKNQELTVEQIVGTNHWEPLKDAFFSVFLKEKLIELLDDEEKLEACLDKVLEEIRAKEQLDELQKKIGAKKIGDFIQSYGVDQFVAYFWTELGAYWKTVEGRRVLRYRKKELMDFLLSMDVPLRDMLNEETWKSIEDWLRINVPELIPPLADFIRRNEAELDEVIKRSIHIAVEKQQKSEYLSWLEEKIQVFIVSQVNISERLQRILELIKENDSDAVVEQILDFLKEQKLCDMVQLVVNNHSDIWRSFWKGSKWREEIKQAIYQSIKDKPLSWLWDRFSLSFSEIICQKGKQKLIDSIQSNSEKTAEWIVCQIRPLGEKIGVIALGNIGNESIEKTSDFLFYKVNQWVNEEEETMIQEIEQYLSKQGKEFVRTYPKEHADVLANEVKNWTLQQWYRWEMEKQPIGQFMAVLNGEEQKELLVKKGVQLLRKEMDQVLQGQIHTLVVDALNKLEPDQLCRQVEKLMGGQLKYLSYFGGFLGFLISAGICYWAVPGLSMYGSPTTWNGLIFGTVAMGIIGVITNIVAIKMLFYPKKQVKWLAKSKYLSLFSEGVILQNQETFAAAMASYVSNELISEEAVQRLYEAKKADFPQMLKQWAEEQGSELLKQNREKLAETIVNGAILYSDTIIDQIKIWLETKSFNQIITSEKLASIINASDLQVYASQKRIEWNKANGEKELSNWFSTEQTQQILSNLIQKGEENLLSYIKNMSLEDIAAQREAWYQAYISREWSLEQKKTFHLLLRRKWNQVNTTKMKEKSLVWLIKKCNYLSQEEKLLGEFLIFDRPMEQLGQELLDKKIESAIDWFYMNVVKKKIEQTFGYQESEKVEADDWWSKFQQDLTSFGMRNIIEPIFRDAIWELKEVQLPLYLKSKKQEFNTMLQIFLKEKVYSTPTGDAVILILGQDYPATLNRLLFGTIWKQPSQMSTILEKVAHMALSLILDQPPKVYLHMLKMDSLVEIEKNIHTSLESLCEDLLLVEEKKEDLANDLAGLLNDIVARTHISEIGSWFNEEVADSITGNLLSQKNVDFVIEVMIKPILENYCIKQMISMEEFVQSVKGMADSYFQSTVVVDRGKEMVAEQIWNIAEYTKLPETMKRQISCYIVEVIGDILQKQIGGIIADLNLYGITEQRLKALTADEMEATIRQFADPIFKTLYALGCLGAVAGVNCYIAILMYLIEKLKGNSD